jgi:Bacterial extracellular solute-binding protein
VATALAISLATMIGIGSKAVIARASCSTHPVIVNLAVSYDIAPAIQTIARAFNSQNETAGGRCVEVQVTPGAPSAVAAQIDGQDSLQGMTPVDAWIPDSSLWVDLARSYPVGARLLQQTGVNVGRSPIMIVTSRAVARHTGVFNAPASWNLLLPSAYGGPPASMGLSVDMPDPSDSAAGLSTLIEVNRLLGPTQAGRTAFTKFVYTTQSTEDFNSVSALESFVASTGAPFFRKAIAVATEQAVVAYDRANPDQPLAARYPAAVSPALGSPELDYPYVLTSANPAVSQAASAFGTYLKGSYAQSTIRYSGFRDSGGIPDIFPAASGLSSQQLQAASASSPSEAATSLSSWQRLGVGSRDLALIDVSAAMGAPDGAGQTLEAELTQTASRGLALFPDSTLMGLWEIPDSVKAGQAYRELVPVGPLPADWGVISRREQLGQIVVTLHPGHTPLRLYDAILDAYQAMTATYAPSYVNAVLVLTSGVDTPHGDMKLTSLLARLRSLYDPNRKVEIVVIMLGRQGNLAPLRQIARITGGAAYQISNPAEVGKIFIEAIANRMCDQGCTAP